ncbi:MAG TPA: cytochrome P450 [Solirubrobacteraceae bacterium]|nr:cytochrome P450 [Solirubrobacteraceae bacterium]
MTAVTERTAAAVAVPSVGAAPGAPPSPAGPAEDAAVTPAPPGPEIPPLLQGLRFALRPMTFHVAAHRRYGDVWTLRLPTRRAGFVVSCHPDHLESLLKARPADAPSLTGESPLRPILGPNSVLTSVGERHMRQRKLLLPAFHGEAVQRYVEMISEVAEREIDTWPSGEPFALAPRMQAITLEVIMRGVFGIEGSPRPGTVEHRMRETIRRLLAMSTHPLYQLLEMRNAGATEARGLLARMISTADRHLYAVIRERRAGGGRGRGDDVLSLLLQARDEAGELLTDQELRDELMSLLLAGHETTANSLAWIFERLVRYPQAYGRLRELVRGSDAAAARDYIEATIHEGMRNRPVIPMIVRLVTRPWRFGDHVLPARTPVAVSIIALHHRADVYPEPNVFAPERFVGVKPGTYTWIPFGGGIRRCLGASLAMAEQRVVLEAIARRTDLTAPSPEPESPRMRNVTMIPRGGCLVAVAHSHSA